jgi:hypothetical protein
MAYHFGVRYANHPGHNRNYVSDVVAKANPSAIFTSDSQLFLFYFTLKYFIPNALSNR